jgi:hypothetical protein
MSMPPVQTAEAAPSPESAGRPGGLLHVYYNFVRIRQILRVTLAMAAGITDRLWSLHDVVALT